MGKRLTGFDYSRPMFYMVTIKCRKGVRALCEIVAPGKCLMNAITRAMVNCIRNFHIRMELILDFAQSVKGKREVRKDCCHCIEVVIACVS